MSFFQIAKIANLMKERLFFGGLFKIVYKSERQ